MLGMYHCHIHFHFHLHQHSHAHAHAWDTSQTDTQTQPPPTPSDPSTPASCPIWHRSCRNDHWLRHTRAAIDVVWAPSDPRRWAVYRRSWSAVCFYLWWPATDGAADEACADAAGGACAGAVDGRPTNDGCGCCGHSQPMLTAPTWTPSRRDGTCPKIEDGFGLASLGWSATFHRGCYCGCCHCPGASSDRRCYCQSPYLKRQVWHPFDFCRYQWCSLSGRSEETEGGTPGSACRTVPRGWCCLKYESEFAPSGWSSSNSMRRKINRIFAASMPFASFVGMNQMPLVSTPGSRRCKLCQRSRAERWLARLTMSSSEKCGLSVVTTHTPRSNKWIIDRRCSSACDEACPHDARNHGTRAFTRGSPTGRLGGRRSSRSSSTSFIVTLHQSISCVRHSSSSTGFNDSNSTLMAKE